MVKIAKIERKVEYFPIIGGEIKATNDSKGIVEGYLNYIGNIDFGDDRTMPGAFRKTLIDSYARKAAQGLDFLFPYLFNHDYGQLPPGGIFEADEDRKGLYIKTQFNLDIQMGRELYASFKMGTMKKQSMGYKAIQTEYVKDEETKRTIRNLLEVAVMEGSAVVFPMNDLAQVDTVKRSIFAMPTLRELGASIQTKGHASGKTSWPLAERGVSWDGGQAKKDIQAWATSGDSVNWSKAAQCFFWVEKSPPENLSQCKMPFVAKSGGSMKAIPAGIIACAGVISGARGGANIDDVDGVKKKIAAYYSKMKMDPPWAKGKSNMDIWSKDYATSYMETTQMDWVSDLWNLWYPLRNEIITAFQTGDTPAEDVQKALDQFSTATLAYIARGIELNMTECLQPADEGEGPMPSYMMSSGDNPETKDVKLLSADAHSKMTKAVAGIEGHIKDMKSQLSRQRANQLQGYRVYGSDDPIPEQKEEDEQEDEQEKEEPFVDIHTMLHDLNMLLSADNANRGL